MKAAYVKTPGPAESIIYGELPVPEPGAGQVRVKTGAVAVNPVDTYVRAGMVAFELPNPFIVGCDVAGVVEAVGPGVTRHRVGDRVWGSNQGLLGRQGTFAEFSVIGEEWLHRTPDGVSDEAAAALSLVGITAHLGLVGRGKLQPGETIFVMGGTGGVGSTVVQLAKALGARVAACCGTDEKVAECRALGADFVVNYKTEDVAARLREFAPEGVDLFWETRRVPDFDAAVPMMRRNGRFILMAGRDARPQFPVGPFYVKGLSLHGFVMFMEPAVVQEACAADLNRWMASGQVRARIDRVLPLSETRQAHEIQEAATIGGSGTLAGKIVLKP